MYFKLRFWSLILMNDINDTKPFLSIGRWNKYIVCAHVSQIQCDTMTITTLHRQKNALKIDNVQYKIHRNVFPFFHRPGHIIWLLYISFLFNSNVCKYDEMYATNIWILKQKYNCAAFILPKSSSCLVIFLLKFQC